MTDLVERLRLGRMRSFKERDQLLMEAADRIEELEKALERMARESDAELARLTGIIFDHTKERMRHSDD